MKTPGGRGELSLSGPYLAFARGRWRGRGVFLPLPDSPGPSSPSPADPGLAPSSRRGRPSPPRAVEAALRLRPPRGRSPPPRFSCPSGAAASFPQRHTGPAGPASSPGSLNRRLGGPDPAAGSRAGIPVPPPPAPRGCALPPQTQGRSAGRCGPVTPLQQPGGGTRVPGPSQQRGPSPPSPTSLVGPALSPTHLHDPLFPLFCLPEASVAPPPSFLSATGIHRQPACPSLALPTQFLLNPTSHRRGLEETDVFTDAHPNAGGVGKGLLLGRRRGPLPRWAGCIVRAAAADPARTMCPFPLCLRFRPLWFIPITGAFVARCKAFRKK